MGRALAGGGGSWERGQDGDTDCGRAPGWPWGDPEVTHHGCEQKGPGPLQPRLGSPCPADQHEAVLRNKKLDYVEMKRIKNRAIGKESHGKQGYVRPLCSED